MDLTGKVALVTGGASGIGYATTKRFLDLGARVAVVDRANARPAAEALGAGAVGFDCDVSDEAQVAGTVAAVLERFGRLDYAFNNAGIEGTMTPVADTDPADFDAVLAVNLRGVFLCLREELKVMEAGAGIVNCASVAGILGIAGAGAYAASKHGVVGLTRSAALDAAARNIRVNALCPGAIRTPMLERAFGDDQARWDGIRSLHPIGRIGEPDEVADAAVWLCASASFVTGQALAVDGGWSVP